jgi:putative inorganic carbon (hco3(-)) transporter
MTAVSLHPGVRARMRTLVADARAGNLSEMTSFRLPAFAAALEMFRDRPAVGVGPGVFSALYMPYKLNLDSRNPEWIRVGNQNFGEVHNDHLQLLAETGLPGYGLFLLALVVLGHLSFRRRDEPDERTRFVHMFAFPAVIAFAVMSLAHFPMQLTSTIAPAVYMAALCFAWADLDEVA